MKNPIYYFGVEVELTTSFAKLEQLLNLLIKHKDILLANDQNPHYLFRDPSIIPTGIFELGYEIKTKKLKVSKTNELKVERLIVDLNNLVTSNDTCSIHIHYSRKGADLKDHYMTLYEFLKCGYDSEYRTLLGYSMDNSNYADYSRCRQKYYYSINRQIKSKGQYLVDDTYDSKELLYTVSTIYNTIEYRGMRHHFENKLPIRIITKRLFDVLHTFMSIDLEALRIKYKDVFVIED